MLQHSKQNTAIFLNFKSSLYEMAKYIPKVVTYEKHNDSWQDRLQDVSVHNIVLVHHHLVEKITSTNGTFIVIAIECFYAQHGTGSASMHGLNMLHLHPLSQKVSKDSTLGPTFQVHLVNGQVWHLHLPLLVGVVGERVADLLPQPRLVPASQPFLVISQSFWGAFLKKRTTVLQIFNLASMD